MLPKKLSCQETGKKKFPTKYHARIRSLQIERRSGSILYTYLCPHCDSWHLTRQIRFEELIELNL